MKLAIVSPHRDDAAFSTAITMAALGQAGVQITIVNLFTTSEYAPYSDAKGRVEISLVRQREDEEFVRQSDPTASLLDLGMEDAPIRLRLLLDRILTDCLSHADYETEVSTVSSRLNCLREFDIVLLPLALGNHIDHRIARDAGLRAVTAGSLAFYEDLPYGCGMTVPAIEAHIGTSMPSKYTEVCAHIINVAEGFLLKQRAAAIYHSQVGEEVADTISRYAATLNGGERVWLTEEWLASMHRMGPGLFGHMQSTSF